MLVLACAQKSNPPAQTVAVQPPPAAPQSAGTLRGQVLESIDAGGYTYLKLRTGSGDLWVAVQQTRAAVGSTAVIAPQMTLENFESKTLKRTFDHIVFGTVAEPQPPMASAIASATATATAADADVNVAKAEGADAKTVAEVWSARAVLRDRQISVHGKVVKFLPGIMGKNWLHLRDGSGDRAKGDNDLTVTTDDTVAVGDVVLVRGTVRTDQDFGSGYSYAVIVEEAKVSK